LITSVSGPRNAVITQLSQKLPSTVVERNMNRSGQAGRAGLSSSHQHHTSQGSMALTSEYNKTGEVEAWGHKTTLHHGDERWPSGKVRPTSSYYAVTCLRGLPPLPIHRQTRISSPPGSSSRFVRTFEFASTTRSTRSHSLARAETECSSWRTRSRS
jgi:hypothetical protein